MAVVDFYAAKWPVFAPPLTATARLQARLYPLAMHLVGRLNGLEANEGGGGFMSAFQTPADLDGMDGFTERETARLERQLEAVADLRVEETAAAGRPAPAFYLHALWANRQALPQAVARMRPWAFPVRLSRLTTAAASALLVLIMTAEAWEVALALPMTTVVGLSLAALAATSAYVIKAQRLLAHPGARRLLEQRAVVNVGTILAVLIGMGVTYVAIFAVALTAGEALFGDALLSRWTGRPEPEADVFFRAQMAAVTAALGLGVGALGASFEPHGYFRHVTHIDDEL